MQSASQQVLGLHVPALPEQFTPLPLFTLLVTWPLQSNGAVAHVAGAFMSTRT